MKNRYKKLMRETEIDGLMNQENNRQTVVHNKNTLEIRKGSTWWSMNKQ